MEVAVAYMAEAEAAMVGEMVVGRGDGGDGGGGEGGSGEGLCLCPCDRVEDVEAGSSSAVPSAAMKAFVRVKVWVWVRVGVRGRGRGQGRVRVGGMWPGYTLVRVPLRVPKGETTKRVGAVPAVRSG